MNLKETRKKMGITQPKAAEMLGIPFRTYCRYEADEKRENTFVYRQLLEKLNKEIANTVLPLSAIQKTVSKICAGYRVGAVYLFGSYAKGKATGKSDIDLLLVSEEDGLRYFDLLGKLEESLGKHVDLLRLEAAIQNPKLMNQILKDGIRIYG